MTGLPNAELAYRVLDHIDARPELWLQSVYIGKAECGTVACFAGWACLLSGDEPDMSAGDRLNSGHVFATTRLRVPDGQRFSDGSVPIRAERLLNANRYINEGDDEERDLFDSCNTREQLGELVEEIFGPRP